MVTYYFDYTKILFLFFTLSASQFCDRLIYHNGTPPHLCMSLSEFQTKPPNSNRRCGCYSWVGSDVILQKRCNYTDP
jgi:hypothetical protein